MLSTVLKEEIFISYAHADNEILPGQPQGWVSNFTDALRTFLSGKISPVPKIWRDIELGKNEFVTDTILDQLSSIGIMVSILSPRYLDSEWALREVSYFCQAADKKRISLKVDNKSRIIRVQKYPLDKDPPKVFNDLIGFDFFQVDTNNRLTEFRLEFESDSKVKFYLKVNELADEIKSLIQSIKKPPEPEEPLPPGSPALTTVYLAETTSDLDEYRSNIKTDLLQRNYHVLPDRPLSYKASDFEEQVRADLQRSKLSIHLLGKDYGFVPEGENRSIIELQHELAYERDQQDSDFTRILWMPESPKSTTPEDLRRRRLADRFIATLSNNTEFVETSLEDLKTVIQDKLNAPATTEPVIHCESDVPLIFVVCDKVDLEEGRKLHDLLYESGYEVILPSTKAKQRKAQEDFQNKLLLSDAVIIYSDQAPDFWVQTKLRELQRIRVKKGPEPFIAEAVYIGGKKTDEKEHFRTRQALLIKNYGVISAKSLEPFLNLIEQKRREQAS